MGNGSSGLPSGVSKEAREYYKNLSGQAKSLGYTLKGSKRLGDLLNSEISRLQVQAQFTSLFAYRYAMEDPTNIDGTIKYAKLGAGTGANTNMYNEININSIYVSIGEDNLVHEHTHNLINHLITKELGFAKGSYEYSKAYMDGAIVKDIQMEAYKKYYADVLKKPWSSKDVPSSQNIEAAVNNSNMRSYALHQYAWAPKGTYIEVPTVAAECFQRVNFDWARLHREYPYAYHIMREIYSRLR